MNYLLEDPVHGLCNSLVPVLIENEFLGLNYQLSDFMFKKFDLR